jgi:hypothetical protein
LGTAASRLSGKGPFFKAPRRAAAAGGGAETVALDALSASVRGSGESRGLAREFRPARGAKTAILRVIVHK